MTEEEIAAMQAELAAAKADLSSAKEKADRAQQDAGKFKRIADKYDGVDLEEFANLKSQAEQLKGLSEEDLQQFNAFRQAAKDDEEKQILEKGGIDALLERKVSGIKEHFEGVIGNVKEENDSLKFQIGEMKASGRRRDLAIAVRDAVSKAGSFRDGTDRYIMTEVEPFVEYAEDGSMVLRKDGDTMFSHEDVAKPMSIAEFVAKEVPKLAPALLKEGKGVGAGKPAGLTDENPFITGTALEQRKLMVDNPALAKKLADAAKKKGHKPKIAI